MNRLGITEEKRLEYLAKNQRDLDIQLQIKSRIERCGEYYKGELKTIQETIDAYMDMKKLLEDNK